MLANATGYAATALGYIAAAGGKPVLVRSIADACEIPAPYLSKIINTLSKNELVTTQRGIGGGVTLNRAPTEVTLFDLCKMLDDPILQPRCILAVTVCSDSRACPAHEFNKACRSKVLNFLQSTTVADIAAFEAKRRWNPAPALPAQ